MGDFLGLGAGVHALAERMFRAVGGHAFLGEAHLAAQLVALFVQHGIGAVDGAVLGRVLLLDIRIHGVVHRRGRHRWIVRGEGDLDHMRCPHGGGVQRVLHCQQRAVACAVRLRAIHRLVCRGVGFHSKQPAHGGFHAIEQAWGSQRDVEFRVDEEVAALCHALGDMQAVQDLRLARHHRFGGWIGAQNALQFLNLELAGLVDQRTRGGVQRGDPLQRQPGAQRHQHDRGQQRFAPLTDTRDEARQAFTRGTALVLRAL